MRYLKRFLFVTIILFLFLSDVNLSLCQESDNYAVFNLSGKKKLYVEGDIFYSLKDINNFLRIIEIQKGRVVLSDPKSKKTFILQSGDKVPLAESNVFFEKTIKLDQPEEVTKNRENSKREGIVEQAVEKIKHARGLSSDGNAAKKIGLDSELFEKIEIQKSGKDIWIVDKKSAKKAFRSIGKELFSVVRQVEPRYKFKEGPSLKVDSELGCVILDRRGFLIQSIAVKKFANKAGLKEGDLVKSINGHDVNTILGLYRAYKNVRRNYKIVSVDIVRDGQNKTLMYKIKS